MLEVLNVQPDTRIVPDSRELQAAVVYALVEIIFHMSVSIFGISQFSRNIFYSTLTEDRAGVR